MTNGEKMQADFPDIEMWGESKDTLDYSLGGMVHRVTKKWWYAEYKEPTTKNDLGVDCISRQSVLDKIQRLIDAEQNNIDENGDYMNYARERVNAYEAIQFFVENDCLCLSVTPQFSSGLDKNSKELEKDFGESDCISRADALRVAKNEYLRGWHNALCKALREKYSIHCEEGNFSVIQEETITGLGLSMNCAAGKDVESYISTIPRVTPIRPKGHWICDGKGRSFADYHCSECGLKLALCGQDIKQRQDSGYSLFCGGCGADMREVEDGSENSYHASNA